MRFLFLEKQKKNNEFYRKQCLRRNFCFAKIRDDWMDFVMFDRVWRTQTHRTAYQRWFPCTSGRLADYLYTIYHKQMRATFPSKRISRPHAGNLGHIHTNITHTHTKWNEKCLQNTANEMSKTVTILSFLCNQFHVYSFWWWIKCLTNWISNRRPTSLK